VSFTVNLGNYKKVSLDGQVFRKPLSHIWLTYRHLCQK